LNTNVPQQVVANNSMDDDDDDEDLDSLVKRIPEDTKTLEECIIGSQGCLLLLMLKQHLKDTYGITDT
jgi:cohesin loading factor subunit SCC2